MESRAHGRSRRAWFAIALVACAAVARSTDAAEPPVSLGEVGVNVARQGVDLSRLVRSAVERELARLDYSRAPRGRTFVLSASLVELESHATERATHARCVVSATLRDARGGAIHAVIEGSARAENDATHRSTAELGAITAAVHSAVASVPDALR